MGYSIRSIGTWIGIISFFAAVIAVANTQIQWRFLWICLGLWLAIVLFYCLVKLVQVVVRMRKYSNKNYRKAEGYFGRLKDEKRQLQKKRGPNYTPLQQRRSKGKGVSFKLPHLAGFAPDEFQASSPYQGPSSLRGPAPQQQQKAKKQEANFKLPPLAGFAPQDLQKPTRKNSRQDSSL